MPCNNRRGRRTQHRPRPGPAVVRPRVDDNTLDEASDIASVDGARDMSKSFAREGSGGFDSSEGSVGLTAADTLATQARLPRRVALHTVVSAAADTMATQARHPLLVEAPLAVNATAATLKNAVASGRKQTSPLTTLSASAVCTGTKTFRVISTSSLTSSASNSAGC